MRPQALKRRLAASCAAIILAGAGIGWAATADADPAPFDWDTYITVITGNTPTNAVTVTSLEDLLIPPALREGGDR